MIRGVHMAEYPEILKVAAENELFAFGNHTYHHRHLTDLSDKEILSELNKQMTFFMN